ncbi:predicted protein [Uncinocarpus reesii 1704]|uniref:Uncharacterized protein n=1 Tax=Uncinocarpus reesii (strain UAMH 1704) TaxID=336963 RepID=C4JY76_UNCRE|nr:uncharacterized protein UREG_07127 [Uncinocarpus reesii 1704]EEP82262.1 predicted protein [Uncinocarpus reesii 1704]
MASMVTGLYRLLKGRFTPPVDPTASLENKTVLVTGGNCGLGLEAVIKYVNLGASTVILGCRSIERGNQAKSTIEILSGRQDIVQVWQLDLNSYDSVIAFSERVNKELSQLDIVLLNAGALNREYLLSPEGWEQTIQVNALSTILLALLLLPKLRDSCTEEGQAHLTFTSSGTHKFVKRSELVSPDNKPILQHINREAKYHSLSQYRTSKILLEFAVKRIALITLEESGKPSVIVNSACPGLCTTNLERDYKTNFVERFFGAIFYFIVGRTAEQGSRSLVSATLLGEDSHGKYWTHDAFPDLSQFLVATEEGKRLQEKAWEEIVEELKIRSPLIEELVRVF